MFIFAAICWAMAVAMAIVRAVQALLNIGVIMQQQLELFIHHIINHVKFDANEGIINLKNALSFIKSLGVLVESHCGSYDQQLVWRKCTHPRVIKLYSLFFLAM